MSTAATAKDKEATKNNKNKPNVINNMWLAAISSVPNLDTSNWNCDSSVLDPIQAAIAAKDNVLQSIPEGTFLDDDDFAAMYPH